MSILDGGVLLAALYALGALSYLIRKARSYGTPPLYAAPQGNPSRGVIYALGKGMMPWEKESARRHLATYMAGVSYHVGVFSGFVILGAKIFSIVLPAVLTRVLQLFLAVGLLSGLGLLLKRLLKTQARNMSHPDDFGANIFTDIFLTAALAATLTIEADTFFLIYSLFLFLYIPSGKIRHCFFFFYSRVLFGRYFGRRGVLPREIGGIER